MASYQYDDEDYQTNMRQRIINQSPYSLPQSSNQEQQQNFEDNFYSNAYLNKSQDVGSDLYEYEKCELAVLEDSFSECNFEKESRDQLYIQVNSFSACHIQKDLNHMSEIPIDKFQSENQPRVLNNIENFFQFNRPIEQKLSSMNYVHQSIFILVTDSQIFSFVEYDLKKMIVQLTINGGHRLLCKIKTLHNQQFLFIFYVTDISLNQLRYDKLSIKLLYYKLNKWNSTLKLGAFYIKNSRIYYKIVTRLYQHISLDRQLKFILNAGKNIFNKYQDELDRIIAKQDCAFERLTKLIERSILFNARKSMIMTFPNQETQIRVKIVEEKITSGNIPLKQFIFSNVEVVFAQENEYFKNKGKFKFSKYFARFLIEEIKGKPKNYYIKKYKYSLNAIFTKQHCNIIIKLRIWKQLIQALLELALVNYSFQFFIPENIYLTARYNVRINLCPLNQNKTEKMVPQSENLESLKNIYDALLCSDTNCIPEFQQTYKCLSLGIQPNQKERVRILECLLDEVQQLTNYYQQFSDEQ